MCTTVANVGTGSWSVILVKHIFDFWINICFNIVLVKIIKLKSKSGNGLRKIN